MRKISSFKAVVLWIPLLAGCQSGGPVEEDVAIKPAKEATSLDPAKPPKISIVGVEEGTLVSEGSLKVHLQVDGYPMEKSWQGAKLLLNDQSPVTVYDHSVVELKGMVPGLNVLRAYLIREWGEIVRVPQAYAQVRFFVGKKATLSKEEVVLPLNSPQGVYTGEAKKKILFDFIVSGTEISPRKSRIRYQLNNEKRELSDWAAFYFQNLKPGNYSLKVDVTDATGRPLKGQWATARSLFTVQGPVQ